MLVEIDFDFYYGSSWPELSLDMNLPDLTVITTPTTDYIKKVTYKFSTVDNSIVFKKTNKKDADTIVENNVIVRDQFVEITNLRIDNILVNKQLLTPYITFLPQYSQGYLDYCNQNNTVPAVELADTAFYFNGIITFKFKNPFWPWYANLRQQEILKNFNSNDIELYFGVNQAENQLLLQKLKNMI
jgi:hypothetical protein